MSVSTDPGARLRCCYFFFFNDPATPEIYTLSLHDALPISTTRMVFFFAPAIAPAIAIAAPRPAGPGRRNRDRSEEHTSELQSPYDLVCRLLLEKKKKYATATHTTTHPSTHTTNSPSAQSSR